MKKQLQKKLSTFIVIMMFSFAVSNAQIVYTDVNPDQAKTCSHVWTNANGGITYLCSNADSIDINNDGIKDFGISLNLDMHRYQFCSGFGCGISDKIAHVYVSAFNSNGVLVNGYPLYLQLNDVISSGNYTSGANMNLRSAAGYTTVSFSGNWNAPSDGYVGISFVSGSQTFYGWIRLSVSLTITMPNTALVSYTIKDYAYNTVANQSILAGQTCSPQATIKANGSLSFCAGGSVVLSSKNSGNTLKYQWKKNNININGATNKNYTATTAGDYKVKVTDTINNCYKTSGIKTVTVPCRNSNENIAETLEHISVYPNPATNSVTIKFPSDEEGEIQIVNLFGQIIYSEKINTEQTQIDVSKFSAGMYVIRWSSLDNNEMKRFSVIK